MTTPVDNAGASVGSI